MTHKSSCELVKNLNTLNNRVTLRKYTGMTCVSVILEKPNFL